MLAQKVHVSIGSIADWEKIKPIYLSSFPRNERQPLKTIVNRIASKQCKLIVLEVGDEPRGFAICWQFDDCASFFLDYLAIEYLCRGKGYGKMLMREILKLSDSLGYQMVLEIENPTLGKNRIERMKRFDFYSSMGFSTVKGVKYQLPPISTSIPTSMYLLCYPANCLGKAVIQKIITRIYQEVYNRNLNDVFLKEILKSMDHE